MARLHVVFGAYEGPIPAAEGEKVVFIGDCATWQGELWGQQVEVESRYQDRRTKNPYHVKHEGIYAKLISVLGKMRRAKKAPHVRLSGCPVSVSEQVMALSSIGGVKNPIFDPAEGVLFNKAYLAWRLMLAWRALTGRRYQRSGECPRGKAAALLPAASEATEEEA